jgi:NAD(P)-dependent dehydrogenase (short-subunit alcohol dehydrogenase family)
MELTGRVALVTGGASGIGRATATRLAAEGMHVHVVDVDRDGAERAAADIGGGATQADVSRADAVDAAFDSCRDAFGRVDLAFLNAGIAIGRADIGALADDEYRRIMGVNVDGVVFGARAAIRVMRAQSGGGVIVATASLAGIVAFPPDPVYTLTKHAVVGFVRSIAPNLVADQITVHAICPGMTDTSIIGEETKELLRAADFPLLAPEEIAEAVVRAATSSSTGTCWVCQPGREPLPYEFHDVPGPRTAGAEGRRPPGIHEGSDFTT